MTRTAGGRLHLVQVTHDMDYGGLQQVVLTLCRFLDPARYRVSVLCLRGTGALAPELEALGVPCRDLSRPDRRPDYLCFLKVARFLREAGAQVVHTHNTQPFVDGALGARLAGIRAIVHTDHARLFPDKRRYQLAEAVASRLVSRVVGVSEDTAANLRRYCRVPASRLVTVLNGIDGERYAAPVDVPRLRRELGLEGRGPVMGLGVRLTEQKGVTYLLEAMPAILARHPGAVLLVAGDGPLLPELTGRAARLGLGDHVRFLGPRLDIPRLLHAFDLYVLPSLWEGLPLVVLEAMAAGVPVVATAVGGTPTAVEDGGTGDLVPPQDPAALGTRVAALLDDPERMRRYAQNARRRFAERFDARVMARRYEALYEEAWAAARQ